jgi:hypothetical protein
MGIAGDYKSVVMPLIFGGRTCSLSTIALAVVLCVMGGCGNRSIIGKWRMSGASAATVWEFSNNGSVLVGDVRGRYKFGDQDRIKIETPFSTAVYHLEISGDHMTLQEPGGTKLEFTKIGEAQR